MHPNSELTSREVIEKRKESRKGYRHSEETKKKKLLVLN